MLQGVLNRIKSLSDGTIRVEVDIPREVCPADVIEWLYAEVMILKKEDVKNAKASIQGR